MPNPKGLKPQAGFISAYRGNTAEQQEAALVAYGVPKLYRAKAGETPLNAKARLRQPTDCLVIAGTLRVFGETRGAIREVTDIFAAEGKIILQIPTGRRSDRDGIAMFDEAWSDVNAELRVRNPEKHKAFASEGGRARAAVYAKKRLAKNKARPIWHDDTINMDEALKRMGWSRQAAYNAFGPRDVPPGRKPKAE